MRDRTKEILPNGLGPVLAPSTRTPLRPSGSVVIQMPVSPTSPTSPTRTARPGPNDAMVYPWLDETIKALVETLQSRVVIIEQHIHKAQKHLFQDAQFRRVHEEIHEHVRAAREILNRLIPLLKEPMGHSDADRTICATIQRRNLLVVQELIVKISDVKVLSQEQADLFSPEVAMAASHVSYGASFDGHNHGNSAHSDQYQSLDDDDLFGLEESVEERSREITKVADDMVIVRDMMRDIALLVESQGETLDRIELHVDSTTQNTADATTQLTAAQKSQIRRTRCCYGIAIAVLITIVILVLIVVFQVYMNSSPAPAPTHAPTHAP